MDIVILLSITLLIYLLPQNKEYLCVKSTSGLRGFLALGIIFHHLSPWVTTGSEFSNFSYMGAYIVSIFFFLSAYGLYNQNENKKNYLDKFLVTRLSKILLPFFAVSLIYLLYRFVDGQLLDLNFFISLFKNGSTIIFNGWFVNIIILMYLFWWYNSTLAFILGLIWAKYQDVIDKVLDRYYFVVLFSVAVLLFVSHHYGNLLSYLHIEDSYSYALAANINNIIFTIYFVVSFLKKINFSNVFLILLGGISFELYMIHGLVISMLGKIFVSSPVNDVLLTIFTLIISISLAWIVNKLVNTITTKVNLL